MKKKMMIALTATAALLSGCAKGFQDNGDTLAKGQAAQEEPSQSPPASTDTGSWDKVEFNGYQAGGTKNNSLVIQIDKAHQSLLFVLPIPMIIPILSQIEIPNLPGAYLTSYSKPNGGGDVLAVSIPLRYIIKDGVFMPSEKLPSGDNLPYVPAGELPGFAIQFPQMPNYQIHLYIGVNVAAVFAELPNVGLPIGFLFPVKNQTKTKVIGAVGYVMPKGGFPGGVYLAAQLPPELARVIDNLIHW